MWKVRIQYKRNIQVLNFTITVILYLKTLKENKKDTEPREPNDESRQPDKEPREPNDESKQPDEDLKEKSNRNNMLK